MAAQPIRIPIDKAGRVVLPKEIRDRLGFDSGTEFEVVEEEDRIILRPISREPKIVNKGGVLVVVPDEMPSISIPDFIKEEREKRIRKFL